MDLAAEALPALNLQVMRRKEEKGKGESEGRVSDGKPRRRTAEPRSRRFQLARGTLGELETRFPELVLVETLSDTHAITLGEHKCKPSPNHIHITSCRSGLPKNFYMMLRSVGNVQKNLG
ncbi:MAG: hypothetical protein Q6352_017000 [Candidatus Freyrarchaeum guaymaensis]